MSEPSAPTGREHAEWCPSETEMATVIAAGARERYAYFLRRVCETRQIWGLHSDGWAILSQGGRRLFPLWPHAVYAGRFQPDDGSGYRPRSIELDLFLDRWLPGMKANGVEAAIFPVDGGESIFVVLDELGSNLRRGLSSAAGPAA